MPSRERRLAPVGECGTLRAAVERFLHASIAPCSMRTIRLVASFVLLTSTACSPRPILPIALAGSADSPQAAANDRGLPASGDVVARSDADVEHVPSTTRELQASGGFLKVTLKIPAAPAGAKALVINPNADEEALLAAGIVVARYRTDWEVLAKAVGKKPEPKAHKNVVGKWMLSSPRVGIVGRRYVGFIDANAMGPVGRVIDLVSAETDIDPLRIGISGSSTYGFIVLEALLHEPRLTAAVVRSACGDYRAFLRWSSLAVDDDPRFLVDGKLVLDVDYDAELVAREPLTHAERYPPTALLLLNGDSDEAIPMQCVEPTILAFRRAYRAKGADQRFRAIVYAGAGHDLGEPAARDELAFWRHWFAGGQADRSARAPEPAVAGGGAATVP